MSNANRKLISGPGETGDDERPCSGKPPGDSGDDDRDRSASSADSSQTPSREPSEPTADSQHAADSDAITIEDDGYVRWFLKTNDENVVIARDILSSVAIVGVVALLLFGVSGYLAAAGRRRER